MSGIVAVGVSIAIAVSATFVPRLLAYALASWWKRRAESKEGTTVKRALSLFCVIYYASFTQATDYAQPVRARVVLQQQACGCEHQPQQVQVQRVVQKIVQQDPQKVVQPVVQEETTTEHEHVQPIVQKIQVERIVQPLVQYVQPIVQRVHVQKIVQPVQVRHVVQKIVQPVRVQQVRHRAAVVRVRTAGVRSSRTLVGARVRDLGTTRRTVRRPLLRAAAAPGVAALRLVTGPFRPIIRRQ